jgi:hypothetical protein
MPSSLEEVTLALMEIDSPAESTTGTSSPWVLPAITLIDIEPQLALALWLAEVDASY